MVICPIAKAVHCTGCILVKVCPAKTWIGDYGKTDETVAKATAESEQKPTAKPDSES